MQPDSAAPWPDDGPARAERRNDFVTVTLYKGR